MNNDEISSVLMSIGGLRINDEVFIIKPDLKVASRFVSEIGNRTLKIKWGKSVKEHSLEVIDNPLWGLDQVFTDEIEALQFSAKVLAHRVAVYSARKEH